MVYLNKGSIFVSSNNNNNLKNIKMSKFEFKKQVLKVKVGQMFTPNVSNDFFTKGKDYQVDSLDYDNGTQTTTVTFTDDDGDKHPISDNYLNNFFSTSKFQ